MLKNKGQCNLNLSQLETTAGLVKRNMESHKSKNEGRDEYAKIYI